jgi:ketosteroid isomerase-like protein
MSVIDYEFALKCTAEWIESWNAHDLDRILSHYADDFEMSSPVIAQAGGEASGVMRGKERVRAYWSAAFERHPDLRFEHITTLAGVNSVTLYYRGVRGLSAEVFEFGPGGKVIKAFAH